MEKKSKSMVLQALLIANMLMASRITLTASIHPLLVRTHSLSISSPTHLTKSFPCPLWSSSFSFCLHNRRKSVTSSSVQYFSSCSSRFPPSMAASGAMDEIPQSNPLLQDFYFPPFDAVEAKHVRPGILTLLKKLVCLFPVLSSPPPRFYCLLIPSCFISFFFSRMYLLNFWSFINLLNLTFLSPFPL